MLFARFTVVASLALSLTFSSLTQAADDGAYIGISTGGTYSNLDYGATNKDNSNIGAKLKVGYQVDRNIAFEMSYTRLGKVTGSAPGVFENYTIKTNKVFDFSGVASLPLTDSLDLTLRAGWYRASTDASDVNRGSINTNASGVVAGIGLKYAVNKNLSLNGEVARYNHVDIGVENFEHDIDFASMGINYKF